MLRNFYRKQNYSFPLAHKVRWWQKISSAFGRKRTCSELCYRNLLPWIKGRLLFNLLYAHIVLDSRRYCLYPLFCVKEFLMCKFIYNTAEFTKRSSMFQMWKSFSKFAFIYDQRRHIFLICKHRNKCDSINNLHRPQQFFLLLRQMFCEKTAVGSWKDKSTLQTEAARICFTVNL